MLHYLEHVPMFTCINEPLWKLMMKLYLMRWNIYKSSLIDVDMQDLFHGLYEKDSQSVAIYRKY